MINYMLFIKVNMIIFLIKSNLQHAQHLVMLSVSLNKTFPSLVVVLYASSHRQDNTYKSLCYTSRGALAGTRNGQMGPPQNVKITY